MPQLQQIITTSLTQINLDQQTFLQLIKAFNIPIDNNYINNYIYDPNTFIVLTEKLKSKLYDVIKSQGKNYADYLKLPKFSVLKYQSKLKLTILLDNIWQQYSRQTISQKEQLYYRDYVNSMLPEFMSIQEIQNYHLQNFGKFKLNKINTNNPSQPLMNTQRNIMQQGNPFAMQPPPLQIDPLLTGFHRPVIGTPFYHHGKIDGDYANGMGKLFVEGSGHLTGQWMEKTLPAQSIIQQHLGNIIQPPHMRNIIDPSQQLPHNPPSNPIFPIPSSHSEVKTQYYQPSKPMQAQQQSQQQQKSLPITYNKLPTSVQNISSFSLTKQNNHLIGNRNTNKDTQKVNNIIRSSSNNSIEQIEIKGKQKEQEQAKFNHITGEDDELYEKIKHYQFIECPCQGNNNSNMRKNNSNKPLTQQYFECKLCHYYFHYECLNITEDTVKVDICPCCKIKQGSNIFVKIHEEPFGKRWCRMHIKQKLSMFLTEREIQRMKEIKLNAKPNSTLQYQLRFLRISNTNKHTLNNLNKKSSLSFSSNSSELRKFNNLPLPSGYIQKIQPYNVFDISLRPSEMKGKGGGSIGEEQECLYIFGIFMIERYSETQITEELFGELNEHNSVGEEYLHRYLIDPQEGVEIKLIDPTSQQPILYPVRGENCQHPEVFDCMSILQYYKQYGEKLIQQHCPVCETEYRHMVVDRFLYDKLREVNTDRQHPSSYDRIKYYGASRVQFLSNQQEQGSQKHQQRSNHQNNNMQQEGQQQKEHQNNNNSQDQQSSHSGDNNDNRDNSDLDDSESLSC